MKVRTGQCAPGDAGAVERVSVEVRDLPGVPGYRVGSDGSVWTCKGGFGGRILTSTWRRMSTPITSIYPKVSICDGAGGKRDAHVHTLVLETFVGPCPPECDVARHLDGNPSNNALSNLRWGTFTENESDKVLHGTKARGEKIFGARLTEKAVTEIKGRVGAGATVEKIAEDYGVHVCTIYRVLNGKTWAWMGVASLAAETGDNAP